MVNKNELFLTIALPTTLRRTFTYLPPQDVDPAAFLPGVRVKVPFQARRLIGVLIGTQVASTLAYEKLKRAEAILDTAPILPDDIYQLCHWAARYYQTSMGDILAFALPTLLRKGHLATPKKVRTQPPVAVTADEPLPLNPAQAEAMQKIIAARGRFVPFLLDGVTGSGKTEVYLQAIDHFLQHEQQVLVLVPEISLTPQTLSRFQARFAVPITMLHSQLTEAQRLNGWLAAKAGVTKIVIGTRSAIFTPLPNLSLIVVDEEHDLSFKQHDRFRYHARDLAIKRASMRQIPIVLGSATPSLESVLNAERGRFVELSLPQRAGNAQLPHYQVIDVGNSQALTGLSEPLLAACQAELQAGNQIMLFLNRRGFAPVLFCVHCRWVAECQRCDSKLVYHQQPRYLQCHLCDAKQSIPKACQHCLNETLAPIGLGTQRLEQNVAEAFPGVPIIRVDRDTTKRKGALQSVLTDITNTDTAVVLGTQMLAKGHHFPNVTLVGIIDADSGFFSSDFRAVEQMGQLLVQVAGRAGRAHKAGRVLIQTRYPQHPLLQQLITQGYRAFAQTLLKERAAAHLPPFMHFAICRAEGVQAQAVENFLLLLKEIALVLDQRVTVLGPLPALIAKRKGHHCLQLIFKCAQRKLLQRYLHDLTLKIEAHPKAKTPVKWLLDVDPLEM